MCIRDSLGDRAQRVHQLDLSSGIAAPGLDDRSAGEIQGLQRIVLREAGDELLVLREFLRGPDAAREGLDLAGQLRGRGGGRAPSVSAQHPSEGDQRRHGDRVVGGARGDRVRGEARHDHLGAGGDVQALAEDRCV